VKKPSITYLTKKLDKIISEKVRNRGKCEMCGNTQTLQCCHIYSRSNRAVRWDELNLLCLCAGCHFFSHKNPLKFTAFVNQHLGDKVDELTRRSNQRIVRTTLNLQEMINEATNPNH
jgi:hypothetical protein